MDRPRIILNKEELDRAEIPLNHVLVKMLHTSEGIKTKGGITVGFNTDTTYSEGDNSWVADLAECYAEVYKVPKTLFFDPNDPRSMDWQTEMELKVGDTVWFSILESKNSPEIICEKALYKSIPYQDCYVAKRIVMRGTQLNGSTLRQETVECYKVISLNGYVLCEPCFKPRISALDELSEKEIDKSRGIVKFAGTPPKRYLREEYCHIEDLQVGDEVLFDPKTALFYLERLENLATFDGNNKYWVVLRRRISAILNRES